jgi:hypothetical protein
MRYNAAMEKEKKPSSPDMKSDGTAADKDQAEDSAETSKEVGGRDGPDPTRFGDWEKNGRCIDF